ncbi:hypothetical protein [Streptomyces sannanensis]|uniref:hypothetical protein n=1 Tax=Streptomyces sannanensis TaxID=285536 RepID=UPI0031E7544C
MRTGRCVHQIPARRKPSLHTPPLGEACLRDADPTPALRRKLVDQLDDLRRALKVRGA